MNNELPGLDSLKKIFEMEIFDKKKLNKMEAQPLSEEEAAAFIDRMMLPTFRTIKDLFDQYYEESRIEQKKHSIGIDLVDGREIFRFAIAIDIKSRVFAIKATLEFDHTCNGVFRTVNLSQYYKEETFDELNESAMDSDGIIDIFTLNYFTLYRDKQEHIKRYRAAVGPE